MEEKKPRIVIHVLIDKELQKKFRAMSIMMEMHLNQALEQAMSEWLEKNGG